MKPRRWEATCRFSSTVSRAKMRVIWNVRPMPAWNTWSGLALVMSWPRNVTWPSSATSYPLITLNKVRSENAGDLERAADAGLEHLVRLSVGDVLAAQRHLALIRDLVPADHVEQGRLARPVRPDQAVDGTFLEGHRAPGQRPDAAVGLLDVGHLQDAHGVPSLPSAPVTVGGVPRAAPGGPDDPYGARGRSPLPTR